jgi:hypothetical protein
MANLRDCGNALRFIALTCIASFIANLLVRVSADQFERACRPGFF